MELLQAVNTVLPYMGEHVITRIEGAKHPTVDLILAAITRYKETLLETGWWFNELHQVIPVNTDGMIEVPKDTLAAYGISHNVAVTGEKFFDLDNGTRYFTKPLEVKIIRDFEFNELPVTAALHIVYSAAIEVYTADLGAEDAIQVLSQLASTNKVLLDRQELRQRKYNSRTAARKYSSYGRLRFR